MPVNPTPLSTPWDTNISPEVLDSVLVEVVQSDNAQGSYVRMEPGNPHPDQEKYPGYLFLTQKTVSHGVVQRYWTTPAFYVQDVRNWEVDYVSDGVGYPIFVRRYKIRRDQYAQILRGTALTGVWNIKLTNAGTLYDPNNPPAVTITGTGTGATAQAFVSPDGTIAWINITAEGQGYTTTPTVTIDPSSGTQATAQAIIQGTVGSNINCVLIKQSTQNFPEDDPRYALFLIETRVYQQFPGPVLTTWNFEPRLEKYVQIDKQLILKTQVPEDPNAEVLADNVTVEYQDLTAVYSAKITSTVPEDLLWENGGSDFVYEATVNHRFPDQITVNPTIFGAVMVSGSDYSSSYGWAIIVDEGYAGPCRAVVTERYTADPTNQAFIDALPQPTQIFPKAQTIFIREYGAIGSNVITKVSTFPIPLTLHDALDVQVDIKGSFDVESSLSALSQLGAVNISGGTVTATEPTGFDSGDSFIVVNEPQRVGVGRVWLYRSIEIFLP